MSMTLNLISHNGSTVIRRLVLDGPIPRVGELVHVPDEALPDMEGHVVAIVTQVTYRITNTTLAAEVDAMASHDTSRDRQETLRQCGWLDADPE